MVARSSTLELHELPSHGSEVDFLRELAEKEPPHAAFIASGVSGLKYFTTLVSSIVPTTFLDEKELACDVSVLVNQANLIHT